MRVPGTGRAVHRLRHDLDFAVSAGLLVAALATIATGIVADVWDLNDFWYHTLAGYVMTGLALSHVLLNGGRLVAYARFRWRAFHRSTPAARPSPATHRSPPRSVPVPADPATGIGRLAHIALTRRGLLGLALGGAVGLVLGRGLRTPPPIAAGSDVGVIYHQWSKPGLVDALGSVASWGQPVELYKAYPGARRIVLPPPPQGDALDQGLAAVRAIAERRSTRDFAPTPMTLDELSRVLYLTAGITAGLHGNARRSAPSSGALYPIEVYPVVHRVEGVPPGVYHYAYREHALEEVRPGDHRQAVVEQGISQAFLGECGVVLFASLILQRMRPKYQDRSYRYGLLEAGHVGENAYLAATALGLGACGVGAFMDDAINEMLGIDGVEEAAVYLVAIGRRAG
jgi:SagB-type dehydrogenase family enzyme